jgi:hypothetical protein
VSTTAALFMMFFVAMAGLALLRHAIYGVFLYVFILYAHPQTQWWGASLPDLRWSLMTAAITLVAAFIHKPPPLSPHVAATQGSMLRLPALIGILAFVCWLIVQVPFAINRDKHIELLTLIIKYVILVVLLYRCIDSEKHLRWFLWAHVLGCFYMGYDAYTTYTGGRFEGFGGPDINEANAGAMQIITGVLIGAGLFLSGNWWERVALLLVMPFMVNGIILTQSRSGFIALAFGGVVFNYFTPKRYRVRVFALSVIAIIGFLSLTNEKFWDRISSLQYGGQEVEGVDTGSGRLAIIEAQMRMFRDYPLGCGHRCTAALSREYMADELLTGVGADRARSSHSTPMTVLVEHGVIGMLFYLLFLAWLAVAFHSLHAKTPAMSPALASVVPGVAAAMAALSLGDLFVDYMKMEIRYWLIALTLAITHLALRQRLEADAIAKHAVLEPDPTVDPAAKPAVGAANDWSQSTSYSQAHGAAAPEARGPIAQRPARRLRYTSNSPGGG